MESPSPPVAYEAVIVSCMVCALPVPVIYIGDQPVATLFSFLVVAILHGIMLGVPVFWLLWWRKAANAFTCTTAGVLIGTLPYAIFFAPGMSGPGVNHVKTLFQLALSGAAAGFVFWHYIVFRTGDVARQLPGHKNIRAPFSTQIAHNERYSNNELFNMFRRGPAGNEYLRKVFTHARPEFEARRVGDLSMTVSADSSGPNRYLISIINTGQHAYKDLRVHHEILLLDAENFGLDTTHMPSELARIPGEPVVMDALLPGKTVRVVRKGYGPHDQYDGPRETALDLEFCLEGRMFTLKNRRWIQVKVDLLNARRS